MKERNLCAKNKGIPRGVFHFLFVVLLLEGTGDTTTQKHGRYFFGSEHLVWREFLDDDLAWS